MQELVPAASRSLETRPGFGIPAMSKSAVHAVRCLEDFSLNNWAQIDVPVQHVLHAGLYSRSISLGPGTVLTGVFIQIPTLLIIRGDVLIYVGDDAPMPVGGYNILKAAAGRKQAFWAVSYVDMTMLFGTNASTMEEAENEFTDEPHLLQTRRKV